MKKLFFVLIIALAFSTQITFAQNDNLNCTGDVCNFNYDPNGDGSGINNTTSGSGGSTTNTTTTTGTGNNTYGPGGVPSGAGASCDYISSQSDYNRCCVNNPNPSYSCAAYSIQAANSQYCKDHPQDASCTGVAGQVTGGGTQSTNAINAATATQSVGTAGSPQSGSADLTKCSAIKFKSILDILIWVKCIITAAIIPLIFIFAFLFFLFSVLKFMMANEKAKKDDARKMIFASLVGLFVMVAVWGIIKIVSSTLGIESTGIPFLQTQYLDPNKSSK